MINGNFAKLFEVDDRQVLVYKDRDEHFVIRFTTNGKFGLLSIELEYDWQDDRDKRFEAVCEEDARSFLRMLK